MDVLVDTSVWSLALRRRAGSLSPPEQAVQGELAELIREGRVVLIGPIRQEVLSGIRDDGVFDRLLERLRAFDDEPLGTEDYEEAARLNNRCRAAGVAGSAIDFLVCAVTTLRGLAIFTTDADFQRYSAHLRLALYQPRATSS